MRKLNSLTIFFPSLNDAKILPYLICKANSIGRKVANDYEIIVINDGSKDDTAFILKQLQNHYPKLRVITHIKNRGYGGALISGFKHARKEWVFYTDGDGQYDPNELTILVELVNKDIDVVNGYKLDRADSLLRTVAGSIYNAVLKNRYHLPISDIDCDFRLIRRKVLTKITLTKQSGAICLELIHKLDKAGANFIETGVHHYPRSFGCSQFFTLRHLITTLNDNITFYKRFLRRTKG